MTKPHLFDAHAEEYTRTVEQAIRISGESHDYFVRLKATLTARALAALRPRSILDFGCGIGLSSVALRREFAEADVTGVDESGESIAIAADRGGDDRRLRYVHSPGDRLPFGDGAFDLAFTACVFHHIPPRDRDAWARELARVVRPGGAVIVFEHNPLNPLTRLVVRRVPFDEGVELLGGGETRALLQAAGLGAGPASYYGFFPRLLAALRPAEPWLRWLPMGAQYYVIGRRS